MKFLICMILWGFLGQLNVESFSEITSSFLWEEEAIFTLFCQKTMKYILKQILENYQVPLWISRLSSLVGTHWMQSHYYSSQLLGSSPSIGYSSALLVIVYLFKQKRGSKANNFLSLRIFIFSFQKVDVTSRAVMEIMTKTIEYLQPNPGKGSLHIFRVSFQVTFNFLW